MTTTGEPTPAPAPEPAPEPPPPAAPPAAPEVDIFGDATIDVPDNAVYRDVKPIRDALAKAQHDYKPLHDAFGGLPEEHREALVAMAPAYGLAETDPSIASDVAYLQAVYPTLVPQDQEIVRGMAAQATSAPTWAAAQLRDAAATLRQGLEGEPAGDPGTPPAPDAGVPVPATFDDPDEPLTRAQLDQWAQEWTQQQAQEASHRELVEAHLADIVNELRGLGYDPDSTDEDEVARITAVTAYSQALPNGSLTEAHHYFESLSQRAVDSYVQGLKANAGRPGPPDGGAPPTGEKELSIQDVPQAILSRLEAVYGPDPQARS